MQPTLAVEDSTTPFSHAAFKWEADPGLWVFLCAGRTLEEFQRRLETWIGRGEDPANIRQYACQPVLAATSQQRVIPKNRGFVAPTASNAELQAIEGESWGDWVGRLRAAGRAVSPATLAGQGGNPAPETRARPEQQSQVISEELWAAIIRQRPKAYSVLMGYNIRTAIVTSGTSRTKLEFPDCPDGIPGTGMWANFDRDVMQPHRPIIVLDGTPESGFMPLPGLRGLAGLT